ncbi:MAG TPA: hypothetical protein VD836_02025 [Solirubrobacteraceae bacterium]|nr:hypothetical protein [Solirubrobacteraceae bacterium]
MIRWATTAACVVVVVFSASFVVARWTAPAKPDRSQLVIAPAPAEPPLRVRTLQGAPKLPRLQRLPSAAPSPPPPVPSPSSLPAAPSPPPAGPSPRSASASSTPAPPAAALRAQVPWPTLRPG